VTRLRRVLPSVASGFRRSCRNDDLRSSRRFADAFTVTCAFTVTIDTVTADAFTVAGRPVAIITVTSRHEMPDMWKT